MLFQMVNSDRIGLVDLGLARIEYDGIGQDVGWNKVDSKFGCSPKYCRYILGKTFKSKTAQGVT